MNGYARQSCFFTLVTICAILLPCLSAAEPISYESHVRPILKTHCFHCHGEAGQVEGGLDLRLRRLVVAGGDSGAAIVPQQPTESLLLQRLLDGDMPPEAVATRPTPQEIATIRAWIADGAVATQEEPLDLNPDHYFTPEERGYWAFQPVVRPSLPEVEASHRARNPVDHLILAQLEPVGLTLSPDAEREILIRRVTLDLLGLPPSPEEVDAFVGDHLADSYERLIDRLLNSPHYGERWGQHWLDVAGYADSDGYTEDDPVRPDAFHYRDYVIRAFNSDKPFDQFIIEQLAGDELVAPPYDNLTPEQAEKLTATGFLRMAPDGTGISGVNQDAARNDMISKTLEIVSTSLLGMTVGCAQCHNHRYDPILQEDYYAIRAIFEPALNWESGQSSGKRRLSLYTDADRAAAAAIELEAQLILDERTLQESIAVEATFEAELAKLDASLHAALREARSTPEKDRTAEQKKLLGAYPSVNVTPASLYLYDKPAADALQQLADRAAAIRGRKPKEEFLQAAWEPANQTPTKTFLFHRGDYSQPKQVIAPRTLAILTSTKTAPIPDNDSGLPSSGRRLAFAKWLTSGEHPLVARVIVNRLWLNHFGRGLVNTPGDFGHLGESPSHPALLDWLAAEFVDSGWSVKHLQRLILSSSTYRQSSARHRSGDSIDRDNSLYWRMPVRRMEAEVLRDSALAVTGELVASAFGSPIPVMPDPVGQFVIGIENSSAGRPGEVIPMQGEDLRRSIYVMMRRSRPLSVLVPFDLPRMEPNCTVRSVSTVSTQSLMMVNSDFIRTRGQQLAERVQREAGTELTEQIRLAWQLAFAASPTSDELGEALAFVGEQTEYFVANPLPEVKDRVNPTPQAEGLASFCHALLSANRFLYID